MNAASVRFFLLSLLFHLLLLWLYWQKGDIELGAAQERLAVSPVPGVLRVHTVLADNMAAIASPDRLAATADAPAPHAGADPAATLDRDYVMPGRLTRLPEPVSDIDLNVPGINDMEVQGSVALTVLVDRDGKVARVIPVIEVESDRVFAERVAQRFLAARFKPGQINGKAVNVQLQITVGSESFAVADEKSERVDQ